MRIAVNTRVLLSTRMEGVCRYIHETLKRMVLAHPEDEFFFFFDRPYDEQFIYASNVTPVVISPQARHPVLHYIWFEISIPRALKKYSIDVFYSGDTYMSLSTDVPTVLVCHDIAYAHYPQHLPWLTRKYYQYFFPRFHERADKVLTVSQATKDDIVARYSLDADQIQVAHNAVKEGMQPLSSIARQKVKDKYTTSKDYFIYVGAVHPRKNVASIIRAFDAFKENTQSDMKLVLIARLAWNAQEFLDTLATAKFKNDIIHLKEIYNEEVNALTASAFAMVYVSFFEGFGLPILEAMHCDVPVITSRVSSMPEVAGDAALLVDPHNISEISMAMTSLYNDPTLRTHLIQKAQQQRQKFDWKRTAAITHNAIKALKDS